MASFLKRILLKGHSTEANPIDFEIRSVTNNNDFAGKVTVVRGRGTDPDNPEMTTPGSNLFHFIVEAIDVLGQRRIVGKFGFFQVAAAQDGYIPGLWAVSVCALDGEPWVPIFAVDKAVALGNALAIAEEQPGTVHLIGVYVDKPAVRSQQAPGGTEDIHQFCDEEGTRLSAVNFDGAWDGPVVGPVNLSKETPAAITSDQTDYPIGTAAVLRLSSDAPRTIISFADGDEGDQRWVINVGDDPITIKDEGGGGKLVGHGADLVLAPNQFLHMWWDAKWRVLGTNGS